MAIGAGRTEILEPLKSWECTTGTGESLSSPSHSFLSNLTQPLLSTVDTILSDHLPSPCSVWRCRRGRHLFQLHLLDLRLSAHGNNWSGRAVGRGGDHDQLRDSMLISLVGFLGLAVVLTARFGNHGLWCAMLAFMALPATMLGLHLPTVERKSFAMVKNPIEA